MGLSCSCDDYDWEPGDICFDIIPDDFTILKSKNSRRCGDCRSKIKPKALALIFGRFKIPKHVVEIAIYGEDGEIPRSPVYLCENCGDMYLNLTAYGFCVSPYDTQDSMRAFIELKADEFAKFKKSTDNT